MTVKEVYNLWKTDDTCKGLLCTYGGIDGGPGYIGFGSCKCENHTNVRYGCDYCPESCSDFHEVSESQSFSTFLILYRNSASYYNEEYHINETDEYYISGHSSVW